MARSRTPAERWGLPTSAGVDPAEALADTGQVERALAAAGRPDRWSTPLSVAYLAWRTGFEPLACRVQPLRQSIEDGFVVFRLRRRGALRQLSVLHVVGPERRSGVGRTIARLLRETGADLAMASGGALGVRAGMVALPATGPLLTWRRLASGDVPAMTELHLPLGAIELF
jgi:hypothetical protein